MGKRIFSVLIAFIIALCCTLSAFAFEPTDFSVHAGSGIFMIYDTDEVIYQKDADKQVYVAALNMLMSSLVIKENCSDLAAYDAVMTSKVQKRLWGTGLSVANLYIGGKYSVRELLYLSLMYSYSDAVVLAANTVFGSEGECVNAMNAKAEELGLKNTVFTDVIGNETSQFSSARDMAILFKTVLEDEELKTILSTRKFELHDNEYREKATTSHEMLTVTPSCMNINPTTVHYYGKAIAGKTTTTTASGRCIASYCESKSTRYICIMLGEPNTTEKDSNGNKIRWDFRDVKNLVEWANSKLSYRQVVAVGGIVGTMPIKHSSSTETLSLASSSDLYATLPNEADGSTVKYVLHLKEEIAKAPVKAGTEMGTAEVYYAEEKLGEITVIAVNDVDSNLFIVIKEALASAVGSKWFKIVIAVLVIGVAVFVGITVSINIAAKKKRSKKVHKDDF